MNDHFYEMYKSMRDLIKNSRELKMHYEDWEFLKSMHELCEQIDLKKPEYFDRWVKENGK